VLILYNRPDDIPEFPVKAVRRNKLLADVIGVNEAPLSGAGFEHRYFSSFHDDFFSSYFGGR